jgi:hypothetical protein
MISGCVFVHECSRDVRLDVMIGDGYWSVGDMVAGADDRGKYERYKIVRLSSNWNFIVVTKIN